MQPQSSLDSAGATMRSVLFVNGPPGAGKDTFARHFQAWLEQYGLQASIFVLSDAIKKVAHRRIGLDPDLPPRAFEQVKDVPSALFGGRTPRQAYIDVADDLRRTEGPEAFANALLPEMRASAEVGLVIVPGVGFADEIAPIVAAFGASSCALLRFAGEFTDSRSRLTIDGALTIDAEPYSQTLTLDFDDLAGTLAGPDYAAWRPPPQLIDQPCEFPGLG